MSIFFSQLELDKILNDDILFPKIGQIIKISLFFELRKNVHNNIHFFSFFRKLVKILDILYRFLTPSQNRTTFYDILDKLSNFSNGYFQLIFWIKYPHFFKTKKNCLEKLFSFEKRTFMSKIFLNSEKKNFFPFGH